MKIAGTANFHHSPEKVFAAMTDPMVLTKTLPGCQSLEQVGPDSYKMVISAGVAAIKGSYIGQVELSNRNPPNSFTMRAEGSGAPGTIQAVVQMTLAPDGEGTLLTYDADAVVGGVIAGVGQRVLGGVAKKTAGEFFKSVDHYLSGGAPTVSAPTRSASSSVPSSFPRVEAPASSIPTSFASGSHSNNLQFLAIGAVIALVGVIVGWLISH